MRVAVLFGILAISLGAHAQPSLYDQAAGLEQAGKGAEAVRLYVRAARGGNGKAAARLAEIYEKGIDGVGRDQAESQKWRNAARTLGEPMTGDFPTPAERQRDQLQPQR